MSIILEEMNFPFFFFSLSDDVTIDTYNGRLNDNVSGIGSVRAQAKRKLKQMWSHASTNQ